MRDLAAGIIIVIFAVVFAVMVVGRFIGEWQFRESPHTGVCYEIRTEFFFGLSQTMSPVDASFCDSDLP